MNIKDKLYYFNKCSSWADAEKYCETLSGGYSAEFILDAVAKANKEVLEGKALYEQDGVAYTKEHNNYELLFALLYVYSVEKCLKVCDFGGSLGSTYQRYKHILPEGTEWSVIEQSNYVKYGKDNVADINFYYNLQELTKERSVNVALFSSSIQYLPNPIVMLSQVGSIADYIVIDETPFYRDDTDDGVYIQHVPSQFYGRETYYPVHVFNRKNFLEVIESLGWKKKFEWLYDGVGTGIPIRNKEQLMETTDRGFLMINMNIQEH